MKISILTTLFLFLLAGPVLKAQQLDVPYFTTEPEVVEGMLDMAGAGPGDFVIDLGSGDGRIVIAAARRGAVGLGVDLDPGRIRESEQNALDAGVDERVIFLEQDLFETDISQADVVTMFLLSAVNLRLRPELLARLRPGARVVSHTFDMGDWEPDLRKTIGIRPVYMWIIPARVYGTWHWTMDDQPCTLRIRQMYQNIEAALTCGGRAFKTRETLLRGSRIVLNFEDIDNGKQYLYHGTVNEDVITGMLTAQGASKKDLLPWSAFRN